MDAVGNRTVGRPRFCGKCGTGLGSEDKFCGNCGEMVADGGDEGMRRAASTSKITRKEGPTPRGGVRFVPLAAALAALCTVGVGATLLGRRTAAGGQTSVPERTAKATTAPEPHAYDYALHVDLSSLDKPTQVRIRFEDLDGLRTVDSRLRHPGAKFDVAARGKGEAVTWRIYYGGTLVRTVVERSDGSSS